MLMGIHWAHPQKTLEVDNWAGQPLKAEEQLSVIWEVVSVHLPTSSPEWNNHCRTNSVLNPTLHLNLHRHLRSLGLRLPYLSEVTYWMKTLAFGRTFTVTFRPDHRLYLPGLTPDLAHSQCTAVSAESGSQGLRTLWPALLSHRSVLLTQAPPFEGLFSEELYSGDSAKPSLWRGGRGTLKTLFT